MFSVNTKWAKKMIQKNPKVLENLNSMENDESWDSEEKIEVEEVEELIEIYEYMLKNEELSNEKILQYKKKIKEAKLVLKEFQWRNVVKILETSIVIEGNNDEWVGSSYDRLAGIFGENGVHRGCKHYREMAQKARAGQRS